MKGILFLLGSCGYPVIELAWRGHTHYSMALAGGVCLCLIDQVCCEKLSGKSLHMRCAAGSGIITGVELVLGLLFNSLLGQQVWDYSQVPLNLLGQVCLPYSLLWGVLSLPAMGVCQLCKRVRSFLLERKDLRKPLT